MEQTQAPETREARPRRIRLHHPYVRITEKKKKEHIYRPNKQGRTIANLELLNTNSGRFKNFTLGLMCATFAVFGALVMVALAHTPKVDNKVQAINSTTTTTGGDSTTAAIITGTGVTGHVPTAVEKAPHQDEEKGHVLSEVTAQSTITLHSDENTTIVFTTTHISQVSVVVKGNATSF
ncbi:hypothetical protein CNYM01_07466 [Colletotrichum nymphaeae SA-01]|uniref:Uncharacterized protein n=1 Tax=Colletotrichum nymphaeae SA-01 TaxID=1460502 RepID=A0A135T8F4_9PEZI|nr:hypothetical protein CNYM01_07466 [Colletotrichum nymphaeae SA-01]